jgi:hypothetical protein
MVSAIYEFVGRFIVRLVWFRYSGQIKLAGAAFAAVSVLAGLLLARRTPPEG